MSKLKKEKLIAFKPNRYKDRYFVSDNGIIYYTTKCAKNPKGELRPLTPSYNPSGYLCCKLSIGHCDYDFYRVHRLIYEAFNGSIPDYDNDGNKMDIDHKDRNKHNNKLSNLRLVTHSDNCKNRKRKK